MICKPLRMKTKFLFAINGSFGRFRYYWSPNSSLTSRNCPWYPFYRTPEVLIISAGQKSVCCCHQFFFLSFSFNVWLSTRLGAGSCPVCLVHYSIFRHHHSQSFGQPSALCRQHPTSPNDVQSLTRDINSWICSNRLRLNEDKTEAIFFSTYCLPSDCLPSSVTVGTSPDVILCGWLGLKHQLTN